MANGIKDNLKKRKKTDKVTKTMGHNRSYTGRDRETIKRVDNKGLVTGKEVVKGRSDEATGPGYEKEKSAYKEIKLGPFEYRKSTSAGNVRKKGRVRDLHSDKLVKRVGTERKARKHTSFSVFGKDIYNKNKEMDPEKADKRHDKMKSKLRKRKKKQQRYEEY